MIRTTLATLGLIVAAGVAHAQMQPPSTPEGRDSRSMPGAVPAIFGGMRLGVVYALLAVVVGEMISARMGLGQRIAFYAASFRAEGVLGTILVLAVIGLTLNFAVVRAESILLRWKGDATMSS